MFRIFAVVLGVLLLQNVEAKEESLKKTCPSPKGPENARVIGNGRNYTVGSKVKFLCNEGFFRRGWPKRITCLPNGQWTKPNVSCVGRSCGDPGSPVNGERVGWLFQYRNSVMFKCLEGYVLEGPKTRTCLANQTWSETQPICKPVQCEEPPKVAGAVMEDTSFMYKAPVHYKCREGFQMRGSPTLTCGANGKWIGQTPVCKAITCEDPGTPLHASRNGSKVFNYKAKLSFQCNKGFILFGSHERTCDEGGQWTGPQPYCVECAGVDTPVFIRKGVHFTHGLVKEKNGNVVTVLTEPANKKEDVVILGQGTQHYAIVEDKIPAVKDIFTGTRVIAKHVENGKYTFAEVKWFDGGKYSVTFEDDKQERERVITIDSIRLLDPPRFCATCPEPERPYNAFRLDVVEEFIPGTEVQYGCEINTKLVGSDKRKCLRSGIWTGEQPRCQITACWDLDVFPPENGERTGNDFGVGSAVTFSCKQGYQLVGNPSLTCQADGKWSGMVPVCKDLCDRQHCEAWEKCVYDNTIDSTKCICRDDLDCMEDFQPVCGSDAKNYNNDCIMKATACRERRSVQKIANGTCSPAAICQIVPKSVCRGYFRNFYFNTTTQKCEKIIAGGCHPSGWNGFTTVQECNRTCSVNVCAQPVDPGPCEVNVSRWAFNLKAGRCKRFNYGGCFGNENNFYTKESCNQRCPPTVRDKRKEGCPRCSSARIREACKESTFAFVGKVERKLPIDPTRKHLRYMMAIDRVLKNTNGSLAEGSAVLRVPYDKTPACSCPSLPRLSFVLMGQIVIESTEVTPELNLLVKPPAFVQKWNKDFEEKLRDKCAKYLNLETSE